MSGNRSTRRRFLAAALTAGVGGLVAGWNMREAEADRALIAVTLDLEMSRNFPAWDATHWDYEKGNLNAETKRYTVEACRRVRAHGGSSVAVAFDRHVFDHFKLTERLARNGIGQDLERLEGFMTGQAHRAVA